jgi:TRAP-type transport system periplasmic protein
VPRQFHNQPEQSHQHQFLVDLWQEVRKATGGVLDVAVHANNGSVAGSDPRVLEMLVAGEVEFATMMGPLIGARVPAMEIQGMPFAFQNSRQAHAAVDGPLGEYLAKEMQAQGIYALPHGALENGLRQICSVEKLVRTPQDLAGYRMRVPAGRILGELFEALGATPVVVNIDGLYAALKERKVDGHENPLAITEVNRLYEVTKAVSITNHVWSGFNLIANLGFWKSLSAASKEAVQHAVKVHVARQREHTVTLNRALEAGLRQRGMQIENVDQAAFRTAIAPAFHARWKERCGTTAWRLLQDAAGRLD